MAKRASSSSSKKKSTSSSEVASVSPVRKTVAPRKSTKKATEISAPAPLTYDLISERAYYISISGTGGSESDNWFRAESELNAERGIV